MTSSVNTWVRMVTREHSQITNPKVATKQFIQISKPVLEFMGLREMKGSEEGGEGD